MYELEQVSRYISVQFPVSIEIITGMKFSCGCHLTGHRFLDLYVWHYFLLADSEIFSVRYNYE
jgi:hypothetical protein